MRLRGGPPGRVRRRLLGGERARLSERRRVQRELGALVAHPPLRVELRERARQHILHAQILDAHEVQDHAVRQPELRLELGGAAGEQRARLRLRREVFPGGDDHRAHRVEAAAPGAAGHLRVLARGQTAEVGPVVLAQVLEAHAARGRVDAHGEGLRREQRLDHAAAKQHLDDFLHDGEQPGVVHAEAAPEELAHAEHLRQLAVARGQAAQTTLTEDVYVVLLRGRR